MIKYYKMKVKKSLNAVFEFLNSSQNIRAENKNGKFGQRSASS